MSVKPRPFIEATMSGFATNLSIFVACAYSAAAPTSTAGRGGAKIFKQLDFETRDWVAHSGWPISKSDLDPYYHKALKNVMLPLDLEKLSEKEAQAEDGLPLRDR